MITYPERFKDITNKDILRYFNSCIKKRIFVKAMKINEPFRVNSMEGDYKQGKAGDYLMVGVEGELYICDKSIFEKSYDFQEASKIQKER